VLNGYDSDEEPVDALSDDDEALREALRGYDLTTHERSKSSSRITRREPSVSADDIIPAIITGPETPTEDFAEGGEGGVLGSEGEGSEGDL
jgi:hypothetical protein